MDRNPWRIRLLAALLPLAAGPALANPLETIDVLCGGTAAEERARLGGEVLRATISLEFALARPGGPVTEVDVLFTPIDAPVQAFGIVANGPVCLLQMPPGEYRLDAWFNGHSRNTRFIVLRDLSSPLRVAVDFPEEPGKDALLVPANAHPPMSKP